MTAEALEGPDARPLTDAQRDELLAEARRLAAKAGQPLEGARRISIDITGPTIAITVRSARFLQALLDMYVLPGPAAKAGALMAQTELEQGLAAFPVETAPPPATRAERRRADR